MNAKIIDGKSIAKTIRTQLTAEIEILAADGVHPTLAVVLVGDDPASLSYIGAKETDCSIVGIRTRNHRLPVATTPGELLSLVAELNVDNDVHGILVQLPLPEGLDEEAVILSLDPSKDVDGFHPFNMGALLLGLDGFLPCTPHGIIKILESIKVETEGSRVVIVGRSRIVGAPLANLLFRKFPGGNATVTVCHSLTADLAEETRRADILIAATGRPKLITADMVKSGAVVIDVGMNRIEDPSVSRGYRLVGDVDFHGVRNVAGAITPVPGGVGPMTRAMLLWNTVLAAKRAVKGAELV